VVQHAVLDVQVHDARLAAAMYVHHVSHILTLNVADFNRFSGLTAVHPAAVHYRSSSGKFLSHHR